MKVTPRPLPAPTFTPRTLEVTFESQKELDAFGSLFNHARVTDVLSDVFDVSDTAFDGLYREAVSIGADVHKKHGELTKAFTETF